MPSQVTAARFGFTELREQFASKGIIFPDYLVYDELDEEKSGVKQFWMKILRNLKPGVTELFIHAAKPTEELRNITGSWKTRSEEYETFTNDAEMTPKASPEIDKSIKNRSKIGPNIDQKSIENSLNQVFGGSRR